MSFCNLLIHGLGGQQQPHLRGNYAVDVVTANEGRSGFEGEDACVQDDYVKSASIDSVVRVHTVSDPIRTDQRGFWRQQKSQSFSAFAVTFVIGVASAVAAVAAGAAFPPVLGVVVITSIVSFSSFGFSFVSFIRLMQAKDQYKQWEDPLPKLIEQRKRAGTEGFSYVYGNQLKGRLVTRSEVQDLWHAQMEKTRSGFLTAVQGLDRVRGMQVREFFQTGLLSREKLAYAFSEEVPASLELLSDQYSGLQTQYKQVCRITEGYKRSLRNQQQERLWANDRQRDLQLQPWIQWFNANYREPLERERHILVIEGRGHRGALVVAGAVDPRVREYDNRLERLNAVFQSMTAPIYALHERNRQQINSWAEREMQRIDQGEDEQLSLFFDPIAQLVSQYGNVEPSVQTDERLYPDLSEDVVPSAPPLEEEYHPPAYNPEWNSVVGEVDWERGILEVTTTRRVYG